jgi:3'-phosphoadenosine 5'-phosphosulfate synthase
MCVGIMVLLAIVFVLSRTGSSASATEMMQQHQHNNIRGGPINTGGVLSIVPENTTTTSSSSSSSVISTTTIQQQQNPQDAGAAADDCDCPSSSQQSDADLLASLRQKALDNTPPHIIECAEAEAGESQAACHLPRQTRFAALSQKGATLWMTGCSGAGKTTIATALEDKLVKHYNKHVYRLDGDNLRTTLNRDLTFTEADRAESVRRTGELAQLFADAGVITLVGLISPYRNDRDLVRKRHEEQGIPFYEIFLDVPVDELKKRDPKGQYAKVESGELKHFTCIDDPYEEPLHPELVLKTHELQIEQSVDMLFRLLERDGILVGAPKVSPPGLPNPDGDVVVDLHVPPELREARIAEAATLPKVLITDIDLNWLQTIGEGWASPLKGFMREGTLLETLHFNSLLVDPFNLTGNVDRLEKKTDFSHFTEHPPPQRVSMSIPITLACTSYTKDAIDNSDKSAVALVTQMGQTVAILRDPEVYANRKEEIVTRMYGVIDPDHPYIRNIYSGGDFLIGGEVELLDRIRYNDGLDPWRKTAKELVQEFQDKGADTVYAFQTRNPTHAGHAYLMRSAGEDLRKKGYQKPVLWLSPLGGWTKSDDVPLDVRVKQHEQVLAAG